MSHNTCRFSTTLSTGQGLVRNTYLFEYRIGVGQKKNAHRPHIQPTWMNVPASILFRRCGWVGDETLSVVWSSALNAKGWACNQTERAVPQCGPVGMPKLRALTISRRYRLVFPAKEDHSINSL